VISFSVCTLTLIPGIFFLSYFFQFILQLLDFFLEYFWDICHAEIPWT